MTAFDGSMALALPGDSGSFVAKILQPEHPVLTGRAEISWNMQGGMTDTCWARTLQGHVVRADDMVLVVLPSGSDEPVIIGVLDQIEQREKPVAKHGPHFALKPDEALTITDAHDDPLVQISMTSNGPNIRLLVPPEGLDVDGALRLSGTEIELEARAGEIRIKAANDVRVEGEIVRLN